MRPPGHKRPAAFRNTADYQYDLAAVQQNQLFIGFNNRFSRALTFFSSYALSKTTNDTDGQGSSLFPANSYDLTGEFGRASFDVRHRFTFAGTLNLPWWQVSLNPFILATTGRPFNITTGQDTNGDRLFTERPAFAPAGTDCNNPTTNIVCTPYGNFNLRPAAGEALIPRNFGEGPGFLSVNLRISKVWNFGNLPSSSAGNARQEGQGHGRRPGRSRVAGGGARHSGRQRGGGARGGRARRRRIGGPRFTPEAELDSQTHSMHFTINFQNCSQGNPTPPVGNLSLPS